MGIAGVRNEPSRHAIDALLDRAGAGDESAREQLLGIDRDRLRQMVASRLDPRLFARVDPSDIVQETLLDTEKRLDAYLRDRPLPFYPWLHRLADPAADRRRCRFRSQLVGQDRRHVGQRRPLRRGARATGI